MTSGKIVIMDILGKKIHFYNQKSEEWTHPYAWQGDGNLSSSGCGIFSLCHCSEWLTGKQQSPEIWADFACQYGGRGDDGTDRPVLLHTIMAHQKSKTLGFCYYEDGLLNDSNLLFDFLLQEKGVALCNLRPGHIVSLVAARIVEDCRQVLAIDSVAESASEKVTDHVQEVIPKTEISWQLYNRHGLSVGTATGYAAFWVDASLPKDYNLLYCL